VSVLAELVAKLSIKVEGGDEAKQALGETTAATDDVETKGGGKLGKFAEISKKAFAIVGAASLAASVAILAAGKAIFSFANDTTATISDLGHKAKQTGLGEEAYQRLGHAATITGSSIDQVGKAAKKIEVQLLDVAGGGGKAFKEALASIGLGVEDIEGLDATARFGLIGDSMRSLGTDAQRAAIASRLFGEEAGPGLAGFLAEGTTGLTALGVAAGDVFTADEIDDAQAFQDSLAGVKRLVTQAVGSLAVSLTPALKSVLGIVREWLAENDEFIRQDLPKLLTTIVGSATKLVPVFMGVAKTVAQLVTDAEPLLERFSIFLGDHLAKGLGSTQSLLQRLLPLVLALAEAILDVVDGIGKAYNWATTLGSIETTQVARGSPGFKQGPGRGGWSKEQQLENWAAGRPGIQSAAEAKAAQDKIDAQEDSRVTQRRTRLLRTTNGGDKWTAEANALAESIGLTRDDIRTLAGKTPKPKARGGGKGKAKAEPVVQEVQLTSFEQLLQSTLGPGFEVKNLDMRKVEMDPASIKPEAVVTVNNFDFKISQEINGQTDAKQIADASATAIRMFFEDELARAGQSLQPNLAR